MSGEFRSNCIFCDAKLTSTTKPEHILLNAFGGRKTTTRVICSDCNERFGGTIDRTAAQQVEDIRNLLQLKSGTGDLPPAIRGLSDGEQNFFLDKSSRPQLAGKPFDIQENSDGTKLLSIKAGNKETLEYYLNHAIKAMKIPSDKIEQALSVGQAIQHSNPSPTVNLQLQFGGEELLRSLTKSCLVLWANEIGNETLRSPIYQEAKLYVTRGGMDFQKSKIFMDYRKLPFEDEIVQNYGKVFNFIFIRSDANGRVLAHFTLYNMIAWTFELAGAGATPNKSVVLVSNSQNTANWDSELPVTIEIANGWPKLEDRGNFDDYTARIQSVLALHSEIGTKTVIHEAVSGTIDEFVSKYGNDMPDEVVKEMCSEIALRAGHALFRVPRSQEIDINDIIARISKKPASKN